MKRAYLIILSVCFIILLISCEYEDYMVDYKYTAIYFPHASIDRTVIAGEYMNIGVGIYLGGRITNTQEEWATYTLDPEILAGTSYTLLPDNYYSIETGDRIVIPKGEFHG